MEGNLFVDQVFEALESRLKAVEDWLWRMIGGKA